MRRNSPRRPPALLLLGLLLVIGAPSRAAADTLTDVQRGGALVWGGDQEGGGPFIFPRADDPAQVTGFEVELAAAIAAELGVQARFAQGDWTKMLDLLRAGKVQIVLNGYEWSPERADALRASIPYYVYGLQLLARNDDASLKGWTDLRRHGPDGPRKLGVLAGSAAEALARRELGTNVELVLYDGNTDAMREVETGKLDATLQDTPIATFYAPRFPRLARIGEPVGKGYYVAYLRREDARLGAAIDGALVRLIQTGRLERIYRRYGLWDERQSELVTLAEQAKFFGVKPSNRVTEPAAATAAGGGALAAQAGRGYAAVARYGGILLQSAGMTVLLAVLSFPLAAAAGLAIAIGRLYGPGWLRAMLATYVEFLRGTPLMLQLYFIFFFLPELGVRIPAFTTAILGLAVNYSAYEAEIYRAGLSSVPRGQLEAALSLGMSRPLAIRRVIVPQAVQLVVPPLVNDFIALFKDTSICSVVTIVELTKRYSVLSMSTGATIELMLMTAVLYLIMSYPLSLASRKLERKLLPVPA